MRKVTLSRLMTRARERADMVGSQFVTDSELRGYLSASYAELYELLYESGVMYFDVVTTEYTGDGSETYDLPDDFYACVRMDYKWSSNYYTELRRYMEEERTQYENAIGGATSGYSTHYQIQGTKLALLPAPSGGTYRLRYCPAPADLEQGDVDQAIDGVAGWEEWIVVDAARKMLSKEESSTAGVERDLQRLEQRIEEAAQNRYYSEPRRVVDVNDRKRETVDWWRYARTRD